MAVAFDAAAFPGSTGGGSGSSFSFSATVTAGSYVLLAFQTYQDHAITGVTYGGVAMSQKASVLNNGNAAYGRTMVYELFNAPGGAQTVSGTMASGGNYGVCIASYTGVDSSSVVTSGGGLSTGVSTGSLTPPTNGLVVGILGMAAGVTSYFTGLTGGTNRAAGYTTSGAAATISDAASTTTFSGSMNTTTYTGWVGMTLTPPVGINVSPSSASIAVTGSTPAVQTTGPLVPASATVLVSTSTPVFGTFVSPASASVSITGSTPTVGAATIVSPTTARVYITGGYGNPFVPLLTKLNAGQSVVIETVGDSTVYGYGDTGGPIGWPGRLGISLGARYGATVTYQRGIGTQTFTLTSGSAQAVFISSPAVSGTTLVNQEGYLTSGGLSFPGGADVIMIGTGFNDAIAGSGTFAADMMTFITNLRTYFPTTPIIVTTENIASTDYGPLFSQMTNALVGQSVPLSPPLQQSGFASNLWVLDTRQACDGSATYRYDGLHPNATGYNAEAAFDLAQLAPLPSASITPSATTVAITTGTPVVAVGTVTTLSPPAATVTLSPGTPTVTATANARSTPTAALVAITTSTPVLSGVAAVFAPQAARVAITGNQLLGIGRKVPRRLTLVTTSSRRSLI